MRSSQLSAAAGAAGSTALDAVTHLDMTVRGRGTSCTPEQTAEALAARTHVPIPATRSTGRTGCRPGVDDRPGRRDRRRTGVGLLRASGFRSQPLVGTPLTTLALPVASDGPMTVLGVTDPRT
jgi:hypothetical protein